MMSWVTRKGRCDESATLVDPVRPVNSRRWLIATVLTAVTAATLMFALNAWSDYRSTLADGWARAERRAFVVKEQTERAFEAARLVAGRIRDIADARGLEYFRGEGWSELAGFPQAAPLIGSVWVIDAEANLVANSLNPDAPRANYADREYYTVLNAGHEEYVTGLLLGRVDPVWFFSYAHAIIIDDVFRGVALMSMHADYFGRLHRDMDFGSDGALGVYRSDGVVVMRWPLQPSDEGASAADTALFREHLPRQPAGRFEATGPDGVPMLTVYATATGAPVVVTAVISRDAVLAPFWHGFYRDLVLFVMAVTLIGGLTYAAHAALQNERDMADRERKGRLKLAALLAERNQLVTSLEESEKRLRLALEAGGMSVWDWDLRARVVSLDSYAASLFNYEPGRLVVSESDAYDQIAPEDLSSVQNAVEQALRGEGPYYTEFRHIGADGAVTWFVGRGEVVRDDDGRPLRMLGLNYDITARKRIEEDLRESEERLRLAQEAGGIGSWDWDLSTDTVIWSASNFRVLGLDPAKVRPSHAAFFDAVHPDDRGPLDAKVQAARRGESTLEAEFRVADSSGGAIRWLQCRGETRRDPDGNPIRMVGVNRDVTSRRRAIDALERLTGELEARVAERTAQLVQAQKMETLGQITGGLAHDFNNLLAAVLGNLELLRKRLAVNGDDAALKMLDEASEGAERGAKLTQRLLAFARRQDLRPDVIDIAVLIAGMENLLRRSLGPSVRIETNFPDDLWLASVDANQLEMAILNLAVNARDAMPDGGVLTVSANNEVAGPAHPAALAAGNYVRLVVSDTGVGMDEETLSRVTEPFFTTKRQGHGTGLGLSMVHGLTGQSGGALRLSSWPGAGTRVEMWLPQARSATGAQARRSEETEPQGLRSWLVLLVEDDWLVASSTEALLKDLGHKVIAVPSAARALEVLQSGGPIDLVITDHAMPEMTGIELIGRIREAWPHLPVLLATGYAELPGGVQFDVPRLSKPYRQADLAARIEQLVGVAQPGAQDGKVVSLRPL
jgi:PAS domain S-box-containing protein